MMRTQQCFSVHAERTLGLFQHTHPASRDKPIHAVRPRHRLARTGVGLLALLCGLFMVGPAQAQVQPRDLFKEQPAARLPALTPAHTSRLEMLRQRPTSAAVTLIQLDPTALQNDTIRLPLSDRRQLNLTKGQVETRAPNDYTWTSTLPSEKSGATLVVRDGNVTGTIRDEGGLFRIEPLGGGLHALIKVDEKRFPPEEPPSFKEIETQSRMRPSLPDRQEVQDTQKSGGNVGIDVLVLYTDAVDKAVADVEATVQLAVAEANQSYTNSGIKLKLTLVGQGKLSYSESGKSHETILADFKGMASVNNMRHNTGADIAVLLVDQPDYCGLASDIMASASTAFALVHYNCATGYYSFSHEIGHLQGARHDPSNDSSTTPYAYGHGFQQTSSSPNWRTIMAYDCANGCSRLQYWSNPNITYSSIAMGSSGTSNNARVLNETATKVAAFKVMPDWKIFNNDIGNFAGWAATSGVKPLSGDFNADGLSDVALLRQASGWSTMPVAFAKGDGSWRITNNALGDFAGWAATSGVTPLTGDFNGDKRMDVALLRQTGGWSTMPVAFANGDGSWRITNSALGDFATWAATSGVKPLTGDFNADGRTDVALLRQASGWNTMPVAFANGDGTWRITNSALGSFASWAATSGVKPLAGDFNADGRTDVALIRQEGGWSTMPVAFADGNGGWSVVNGAAGDFAGWATSSGVQVITGDFNADKRLDVALVRQVSGWTTVPVAYANGSGTWRIVNSPAGDFAGWAATSGAKPLSGDFNADGRTDLALIRQSSGWNTMPVAFANADGTWRIANSETWKFAEWATSSAVLPLVGDFDGNKRLDVGLIRQTSGWSTLPVALAQ